MQFQTCLLSPSVPNVILILLSIYYLFIKKEVGSVLIVLFIYLTLHGGYAVYAATIADGINTMNYLHYQSSDLGAKLLGGGFLIYLMVLLYIRSKKAGLKVRTNSSLKLNTFFLLVIYIIAMGYGIKNILDTNPGFLFLGFKETLFSVFMWAFAFIIIPSLKVTFKYWDDFNQDVVIIISILLGLMIPIGIYEIMSGMVWAGTGTSLRISGTLFNPNVLAFWCSLMLLFISFMFHIQKISRLTLFSLMTIVVFDIILTASRGTGVILPFIILFSSLFLMIFIRKSVRVSKVDMFWPLVCFLLIFSIFEAVLKFSTPSNYLLVNTIDSNLQRLLLTPKDTFTAIMGMIPLEITQEFARGHASSRLMESIDGRTAVGYYSDNSFLSIYSIGGNVALGTWLSIWVVFGWIGFNKYLKFPNIYSVYALVGLIFCFTSGAFLRSAQLFPIWIFLALVLGVCLSWWLSVDNQDMCKEIKYRDKNV